MTISRGGSASLGRWLLVGAAALVAGVAVVRTAAVNSFADHAPDLAARVWADHPDVALSLAFAAIGRSAALRQEPSPAVIESIRRASRRAPLAPEPFLVRGVSAQVKGELAVAEQAFLEARRRHPRSRAARYFLAEHYLRTGRLAAGLQEISVLARLVPQAAGSTAPFLATFARAPGGSAELRRLFDRQPELRGPVLTELAKDPANARLILSLAGRSANDAPQGWQAQLIDSLLRAGDYRQAHQIWRSVAGVSQPGLLFDPAFRGSSAPAPFNWTLAAGGTGFAERVDNGLHVVFYGRDNATLASQLLVLEPGSYRLAMRVAGDTRASLLAWRVICLPGRNGVAEVPLNKAATGGRLEAAFVVPGGCPAQQLELAGTAPDVPRQVDVTISQLSLTRAPAR